LLKLRELALREKTKAELAWLEQQKRQVRSKGADDKYPAIKKRQKMLIRRLQQQQAEIKRLREVQKAASKERQLLLLQSQEISKMRKSAKEVGAFGVYYMYTASYTRLIDCMLWLLPIDQCTYSFDCT
jgi:hypothetical protein